MKNLAVIRNSLRDIAMLLAKDEHIQKFLLVDAYDVDGASFTPISLDEMLKKNYICLTPQNENAIKDMGRNTFLMIVLQDVQITEASLNATGRIYVATDQEHSMVKNYQDRALILSDYILRLLDGVKISASGEVHITYISRVVYNELLSGYQISFKYNDQNNSEVEI